jgi:hypothetical protein
MSEHSAESDALVDAVYEFLVSEGYHAHYPSAEAQAEKFVASLRAEGWRITPPGKTDA